MYTQFNRIPIHRSRSIAKKHSISAKNRCITILCSSKQIVTILLVFLLISVVNTTSPSGSNELNSGNTTLKKMVEVNSDSKNNIKGSNETRKRDFEQIPNPKKSSPEPDQSCSEFESNETDLDLSSDLLSKNESDEIGANMPFIYDLMKVILEKTQIIKKKDSKIDEDEYKSKKKENKIVKDDLAFKRNEHQINLSLIFIGYFFDKKLNDEIKTHINKIKEYDNEMDEDGIQMDEDHENFKYFIKNRRIYGRHISLFKDIESRNDVYEKYINKYKILYDVKSSRTNEDFVILFVDLLIDISTEYNHTKQKPDDKLKINITILKILNKVATTELKKEDIIDLNQNLINLCNIEINRFYDKKYCFYADFYLEEIDAAKNRIIQSIKRYEDKYQKTDLKTKKKPLNIYGKEPILKLENVKKFLEFTANALAMIEETKKNQNILKNIFHLELVEILKYSMLDFEGKLAQLQLQSKVENSEETPRLMVKSTNTPQKTHHKLQNQKRQRLSNPSLDPDDNYSDQQKKVASQKEFSMTAIEIFIMKNKSLMGNYQYLLVFIDMLVNNEKYKVQIKNAEYEFLKLSMSREIRDKKNNRYKNH